MKVTLTTDLNLSVVNLPFEFYFSSGNKNKGTHSKNYWFTPTGKCRIYFGGCHVRHLGRYNEADEKKLVAAMIKNKCDILTDGAAYYTRAGSDVAQLTNMYAIIAEATNEWEARKEIEEWEDRKGYDPDLNMIEIS